MVRFEGSCACRGLRALAAGNRLIGEYDVLYFLPVPIGKGESVYMQVIVKFAIM